MDAETFAALLDDLFSNEPEAGKSVYFFGAPIGPIKIGFTEALARREQMLRARFGTEGCFLAVANGGAKRERAYHLKYEHLRLDGEWFERHPDILAEIDRLNGALICSPRVPVSFMEVM
ncbi:MAG: GIY-YIG nuclease family protein [Sphingomonas sp.]